MPPATLTTTILDVGDGVTVWTNVHANGVTLRVVMTVEVLEVYEDGVMIAITPPPADLVIENIDQRVKGPLTDPSARD